MRRLFRQVLVYGSGRLALQLLSFLTLPILTRVLSVADYGVMETLLALVGAVAIVATLSLDAAALRDYYDVDDPDQRRLVLGTAFWPVIAWASTVTLAAVLAREQIARVLFGDDEHAMVVALAMAGLPLAVITTYFLEVMRLRHQPLRYVLVSWFGALTSVAAILYLVAVQDRGLEGFYAAGLLTAVPTLCVAWLFARGAIAPRVDRRRLRRMLLYSLPLAGVAATGWVTQFIDRFFVLRLASVEDVGFYALGSRLAGVLLLGVTAFAFAWGPFVLDLHARDPDGEKRLRARVLSYVVAIAVVGAVCVTIYAREFFRTVTDPDFEPAYRVVGVLCAGIVALAIQLVAATGITISRRTRYFAVYAGTAAAANIVLNIVLIPPFGIVGAAVATSLSQMLFAALTYLRAQRLEPVPFAIGRAIAACILGAGFCVVGSLFTLDPAWLSALAKTPIVIAVALGVWVVALDAPARRFLRAPTAAARG